MLRFNASRKKIERAEKHINDIDGVLDSFANSGFYTLSIDKDVNRRTHTLRVDFDKSKFPAVDIAIMIGDVLHDLRSSLDILYFSLVANGTATKWTRFPVADTRNALMASLKSALKQKQITPELHDFILDNVKPYETGNHTIWAVHDLNIRDKHQLLIPVLQLMVFSNIRLEDDQGKQLTFDLFFDRPSATRIREFDGSSEVAVKNNGHASATVIFNLGVPLQGEAVVPTLLQIAQQFTSTIEAFEAAGF